ncbi:MAG: 4-(cytidine 5'-diphospho)-2-C-methyl-D-erythritol kinase [Candidatus Omnitrophica bacterium]|nr:4-(cytidine 5'-diphospho)-2-C-methyl-D-erythritol kinase [Candidatus Omnitrophota bacterium]
MKSICLRSPAKLNLSLHVVSKRPDGYHNLSTLFEKINLFDDIRLSLRADKRIRIFCDHPSVPKGPKNLVYKAAEMLRKDCQVSIGIDIHIKKRIPVAAGLAGGSSNAATVLLGLNQIWGLKLTENQLVCYAKRIGSDVPLFIYKYIWALGVERGDCIKNVNLSNKMWHILIIPGIKVYSQEVFRAFKMKLTKRKDNATILTRALREGAYQKVSQLLLNDLEAAIVHAHPQLLKIKNNIEYMTGLNMCFSGSGPSIFGIVESEKEAKKMQSILSARYKQVFVVRTL